MVSGFFERTNFRIGSKISFVCGVNKIDSGDGIWYNGVLSGRKG